MKGQDGAEVAPGLWVGSLQFAQDSQSLEQLGIVRVLTFGSRLNPQLEWQSGATLSCRCYDIEDHPCADLLGVLPSAIREIDKIMKSRKGESRPCVLVHCASGISRSVAVCTAWIMLRQAMQLEEALIQVRKARPQALPNHGFVQCLQLLENAKGDLKAAHKSWEDANVMSRNSRDRCVARLREKADKVAARAASLEEQLQNLDVENTSMMRSFVHALRKLEKDIEKLKPRRTIDDTVASAVRKSTAEKVGYLISTWEPKLPPLEESEEVGQTIMMDLEPEEDDDDEEADRETMDCSQDQEMPAKPKLVAGRSELFMAVMR